MKRRAALSSSDEIRTPPTTEDASTSGDDAAEEVHPRRWYGPRWWQRLLSVLVLLAVLLSVAVVVLRPRIEHWWSQVVHPTVAVPHVTPSPAPRRLPHVTTSLPTSPTVTPVPATALPLLTPTAAPAAAPPPPTATAVSGPATITVTIACTASQTNPGFCEFQNGSTITTHNGASCSLTLGVWSYVGQQTEPVGCAEPHASDLSFVGASVPCSTDGKGVCAGDVASQQK